MGLRERVDLQCPGSRTSYTVLVSTPWQARYGIANPANVGSCPLVISALDENGQPVEHGHNNVVLQPGESRGHYTPPAGAAQIVAVCVNDCSGSTALEYDAPVA